MLDRISTEQPVNAASRLPPSQPKRRRFLPDPIAFRASALLLGLVATSNLIYAQDPATARVTSIDDRGLAQASLEEKYAALENVNIDLEQKLAALEKSRGDLEKTTDQLKQTVQTMKAASKRLSSNLARRISRNLARHVAVTAGTSIPYIGVDVSVAMTALDIKEGCESLRELNEMNRVMNSERVDETHVCGMQAPAREEAIAQVVFNWRLAYGNAAAWANQYETRLPPEPPHVSYAHAGELWRAVFGVTPNTSLPPSPTLPISPAPTSLPAFPTPPTPPTAPVVPTFRRP